MPRRYRKLRGDTAYYPFAARTGLRARQRRHARLLRVLGTAALALAAVLLVRQTVFRGGQPNAPAPIAAAQTTAPGQAHVTVAPVAATRDALADTREADAAAHTTPESAAAPTVESTAILPQYRALYEENPDLVGWLRIDGTNINNVVMFAPDTPGKYLHMDFYGKWSYRGTLYVAENCDVRTADNILIYGHHMKDGSMFGSLISYKDAAFRVAHPIVQFDTLYASHSYEVVAAIETEIPAEGSDAFRYYDCVGTDAQQFAQYCAFIEENRCYDTGITIQPGDRLLTLSTCAYHTANGRFLVVARQID